MIAHLLAALRWLWFSQPEESIYEHHISRSDLERANREEYLANRYGASPTETLYRAWLKEPKRPRRGRKETRLMTTFHDQQEAR